MIGSRPLESGYHFRVKDIKQKITVQALECNLYDNKGILLLETYTSQWR